MLKEVVEIIIGLVVVGALAETAFTMIEDYTPTDPNMALIYGTIEVFAIIGLSLLFIKVVTDKL